jgi:phage tail protein X
MTKITDEMIRKVAEVFATRDKILAENSHNRWGPEFAARAALSLVLPDIEAQRHDA